MKSYNPIYWLLDRYVKKSKRFKEPVFANLPWLRTYFLASRATVNNALIVLNLFVNRFLESF